MGILENNLTYLNLFYVVERKNILNYNFPNIKSTLK